MTVLLSMVHILYSLIPIWLILILVFIVSVGAASVMYYLVEKPAIKFGKYLTSKKEIVIESNKNIQKKEWIS